MWNQLILIVGPKHSGKSVAARAIKKITGGDTVDLDEIVERQTGKKVRALFKEGPEVFRKAEALALASLIQTAEQDSGQDKGLRIIAAGGGLIDNPEALALLAGPQVPSAHREIIIVYLDVSAETAWQRILRGSANSTGQKGELPPFLNTDNPRETHLALHTRRAEAYKALSHFTINAENKSPEEIAAEIAGLLQTQ